MKFGLAEAEGELEERIEDEGLKSQILANLTADKITSRQVSVKVRKQISP